MKTFLIVIILVVLGLFTGTYCGIQTFGSNRAVIMLDIFTKEIFSTAKHQKVYTAQENLEFLFNLLDE